MLRLPRHMAEPTQAGAAACLSRSSPPHPAPTPAAARDPRPCSRHGWLHGPSAGWGPPGITPATPGCTGAAGPGAHVGSLRGWASRQELEGPGRKEGAPLCHPQPVPALLPAALFVPSLRGSPEISPSSWLLAVPPLPAPGRAAVAGGGTGCGVGVRGTGGLCALLCPSGCGSPAAVLGGGVSWGRGALGCAATAAASARPLEEVGGSGSGAATPTPMPRVLPVPAFTPAADKPVRCQPGPCPAGGCCGVQGGAGCRRGCGAGGVLIDNVWASRLAWEPSCGPGAGAASGGVNIAPAHEDVTRCAARGPALRWGGPVAPL